MGNCATLIVTYLLVFTITAATELGYVINVYKSRDELHQLPVNTDRAVSDTEFARLSVVMTSKSGQKFKCFLPIDASQKTEISDPAVTTGDLSQVTSKSIVDRVSQFRGTCLTHQQEYWVFEVCPYRYVRKFHNQDGIESPQLSLGKYEESYDRVDTSRRSSRYDLYEQHYLGGTSHRQTRVRYSCNKSKGISVISNVEKISPKVYQIVIETPEACVTSGKAFGGRDTVDEVIGNIVRQRLCYQKTEGWWTYEICPGSTVRQYHRDADGHIHDDYLLGRFDEKFPRDSTSKRGSIERETFIDNGREQHLKVYAEEYERGTVCAETTRFRQTRLLYHCSPLNHGYVSSVRETSTCQYTISLALPELCEIPEFVPEIPSTSDALAVDCIPLKTSAAA